MLGWGAQANVVQVRLWLLSQAQLFVGAFTSAAAVVQGGTEAAQAEVGDGACVLRARGVQVRGAVHALPSPLPFGRGEWILTMNLGVVTAVASGAVAAFRLKGRQRVTFEYTGRQNPVKVQYNETKVDITGNEGQGYWGLVGI